MIVEGDYRAISLSRSLRLVYIVDPVIYDMIIITWLEFKEQFLRYFYSPLMRDNYGWQLMHIAVSIEVDP